MLTFHSMQLQLQKLVADEIETRPFIALGYSNMAISTAWTMDYRVADRRDSREYAVREVAGKTARGIRWNYAGEDRLLGWADGDMLSCKDGRRSAAERLSSRMLEIP
jgi:hypothetical protein